MYNVHTLIRYLTQPDKEFPNSSLDVDYYDCVRSDDKVRGTFMSTFYFLGTTRHALLLSSEVHIVYLY